MKYAIITTTINVPVLLEKYADDVIKHKRDCFFVVIGDKKTPPEAKTYCENLAKEKNLDMTFMNVEDQEKYLEDFPELGAHIQWNCIMRRNIGILHAYRKGAEVFITIDDDNFFLSEDFAGLHTVGDEKTVEIISSDTGWFNVCSFLKEEFGRTFYHRGFAQETRFMEEKTKSEEKKVKVVANAGFWLGDPDVDALTRLYYLAKPINAVSYERNSNFALSHGTWSPFNSQNTSLARETIPAYFLSPKVGRYDDIWGSYVLKKIADHLGHYVTFGFPLVDQKRNPHNYFKDLDTERGGVTLTMPFIEALEKIELQGKNYPECYAEITKALPEKFNNGEALTPENDAFFRDYVEGMRIWIKTFERLSALPK